MAHYTINFLAVNYPLQVYYNFINIFYCCARHRAKMYAACLIILRGCIFFII